MVTNHRATRHDAAEMAPLMRAEDAAEVWLADGHTPYEALEWALRASGPEAWTVRFDNKIAAMWGVAAVSLLSGFAVPWLLTTGEVDRHPRAFIRACREGVAHLRSKHSILVNRIDARYEKALRWAARMGFSVYGPQTVQGYTFYSIMLKGEH